MERQERLSPYDAKYTGDFGSLPSNTPSQNSRAIAGGRRAGYPQTISLSPEPSAHRRPTPDDFAGRSSAGGSPQTVSIPAYGADEQGGSGSGTIDGASAFDFLAPSGGSARFGLGMGGSTSPGATLSAPQLAAYEFAAGRSMRTSIPLKSAPATALARGGPARSATPTQASVRAAGSGAVDSDDEGEDERSEEDEEDELEDEMMDVEPRSSTSTSSRWRWTWSIPVRRGRDSSAGVLGEW